MSCNAYEHCNSSSACCTSSNWGSRPQQKPSNCFSQITRTPQQAHNRRQLRMLPHAPIVLCLHLVYWRISLTLSVTGGRRVAISGPWGEPGTALGANQGSIDGKLPLLLLGTIDTKAAPVCAAACCDLADHDCCALFRFWGDKLRENWGSKRRR